MQRLLTSVSTCGSGVGAHFTFPSSVSSSDTRLVLPSTLLGPLDELIYFTKMAENISEEERVR